MVNVPSNLTPVLLSALPAYGGTDPAGWVPYSYGGVTYKAQLSQINFSYGTVTSVDASGGTTGLTFSGGPITTSGTLTLGGTLAVANGGTGSTTAALARAALLPSYGGNALKRLTVNAGATDVEWVTDGGGTVTSVGQSFTGGLISVAGSPITGSGTLALTVAGTSGGIPYFNSASTWATSAALAANALVIGGGAGAAPATTTTGAGVITLLAGASSGTGGPAGTVSPTFTGTVAAAAVTLSGNLTISGSAGIAANGPNSDTRNTLNLTNNWLYADGGFYAFRSGTAHDFNIDVYNSGANTNAFKIAQTGGVTLGAALTYGGVTLSNSVTGTGSMVLSASPTFTGTTNFANQTVSGAISFGSAVNGDYINSGLHQINVALNNVGVGTFTSTGFQGAIGATTPSTVRGTSINSTSSLYQLNGTNAFAQSGNYTILYTSNINDFLTAGNASDPRTYYKNTTHRFISTSGAVFSEIGSGYISSGAASTTQGSLLLHNTTANSVTLKSSNSTSAAYTLTLPVDDGTSGQVLSTDGSGVTSWTTAATQTSGDFATLPTLSSTGGGNSTTYTTQTAKSVVTGKAVIDNVVLVFATASGGSGSTQITNALSNAPSTDVSIAIGYFQAPSGISSTYQMLTMVVLAGTTTGLLYGYNLSLGTSGRITNSNMAVAGNAISYSAAYMIP